MTGEQTYIVRLLRMLEELLVQCSHRGEGERIGKIAEKISHADNLTLALRRLYTVEGLDQFTLKLMYRADRVRESLHPIPDKRILDYQVQDLYTVLFVSRRKQFVEESVDGREGLIAEDLPSALRRFHGEMEKMKKGAFEGGTFKGVEASLLKSVESEVEKLLQIATKENNHDVARFSSACLHFIRFVVDRGIFQDIRVVNFLDNANLTLQTVLETVGGDDYDSLQQTIHLLENPSTLLE